ncbi:hypothetical protein PR370_06055 [Mycobacterium marinum]|uniref:hypothetical protein n=1 Tax=Mycobacterium marinum TaxID=1781 RepID=UPI0023581F06|nr:hypothetical protein [Mycobacterium marinum]MDC8982169.1 hypothetical protein [Mycobacterium marinum]MDC8998891.1 hypothetical protein [Mycobacterium marinum]MDC9009602.1 hypothetical protein [Mycobacterium marinum]
MGQYPTPSDQEIVAAVDQAGWLLEQQAARVLADHDFNARPSWAFSDPDEPTKSRELDVWSYRRYLSDASTKVYVGATVLVECKQSEQPYCAIGQELPDWRRAGNPAEHTLPVRFVPRIFNFEKNQLEYGHCWDVVGFRDLGLRHGQSHFRATQLTRLDLHNKKWSASNAGIFNSLVYPLAKAVRADQKTQGSGHRREKWLKSEPKGTNRTGYVGYRVRFPVVLISCPLHVIDASATQPVVTPSKWVRVQRHLESQSLTGVFEFDIVTRDFFVEYVETVVHGFMTELASTVHADPFRYTGELWMPPGVPTEGNYSSTLPVNDWV